MPLRTLLSDKLPAQVPVALTNRDTILMRAKKRSSREIEQLKIIPA